MPIQFTVAEKCIPLAKAGIQRKYYATARSRGEINIRSMAKKISDSSEFTTTEVMRVLRHLINLIPQELSEGQIVRMGSLGSFSLTLKSRGESDPSSVTEESIESYRLNFKPGQAIRERMSETQFVRGGSSRLMY